MKLARGTAKNTPHMPNIAPNKNTDNSTTTAGSLTTPDIRNGRKILPSMF
tara:strand:+ start:296 stop:445 length:150 start_codon:yes stop_codon:yes gene_type:complete